MADYFYKSQADLFNFYRLPEALFKDEMYVNLSPEAKILYSILLKRMELSARNGWLDSQGRVFIIFTLEEIMEKLHCADNKATKLMKELEKCDLIARRRQGMGRPNLIYVKNFIQNVDNSGSSPPDSSESRIKTRENHDSGLAETTNHDSLESRGSYRDISDTDKSDRDNLINLEAMDGLSNHALYEKYFRNALDYPILLQSYPLEKVVLQLISVRLLCAVAEDFRYAETSVVLSCGGDEFSRRGRSILAPGWKGIWQQFYPEKKREEDIIGSMPDQGSELRIDQSEIKAGKTSPPKHFTEDTLLYAMENAGADETPDEAERKGLGTPATRAATIEKLVQRGFIERKGDRKTRQLIATEKGNALVTVMPEQIQSASMTAEWEQKLLDVEHGDLDAADFMEGIRSMIAGLVGTYEKVKGADALMSNNKVAGKCPHCGAEVL